MTWPKFIVVLLGVTGLIGGVATGLAASVRDETRSAVELQGERLRSHVALANQRMEMIERILEEIRSDVKEIKRR